jgi:hypothetical protein
MREALSNRIISQDILWFGRAKLPLRPNIKAAQQAEQHNSWTALRGLRRPTNNVEQVHALL